MEKITTGLEQNGWNIAATQRLQIDTDAPFSSFTLTQDRLVKVEVQLGNAANLLHADGGILTVFVKLTPVDTDDQCIMLQKQMRLSAGDRLALISLDPFWAKSGSIIEVWAKSTNAGDASVGGMVWIYDVAPGASSAAVVTALMADTGFTAGGTMTYEKLMRLLAGMVAGTWRDKPSDSTKQELLDADDGSTILLEIELATSTPYKQVTIQ